MFVCLNEIKTLVKLNKGFGDVKAIAVAQEKELIPIDSDNDSESDISISIQGFSSTVAHLNEEEESEKVVIVS